MADEQKQLLQLLVLKQLDQAFHFVNQVPTVFQHPRRLSMVLLHKEHSHVVTMVTAITQ